MFVAATLLLSVLVVGACAERRVIGGKGDKSAFLVSLANPVGSAENNAIAFAMGTSGPWGNDLPPFVFTAFASGEFENATLKDPKQLLASRTSSARRQRGAVIDEAAAILYAHWGIGEWCERDDEAGFQGEWPPPLGNGLKVLLEAVFDNDTWTKDTFLTGATWRDTVFQDIETGEEEDGRKFAEIKTVNKEGQDEPVYKMRCKAGKAGQEVEGLDLGQFRFKCDFTISPAGLWVDEIKDIDKPGLFNSPSLLEKLETRKGCPPERRKLYLAAALAANELGEAIDRTSMQAPKWQRLDAGKAEFAFVNEVQIWKDGKDTGERRAAHAHVEPLENLINTNGLPAFLRSTQMILFTFDASRADLKDGESLFFDPTFGFADDPCNTENSVCDNSSASSVVLSLAALIATLAIAIAI